MTQLQAEACPNCGAPLHLDPQGLCSFCRAPIRTAAAASSDAPPPADKLLRAIGGLIDEPAVQRVVEKEGLADGTHALTSAIIAAGQRVTDAGLVLDRWVDIKIYEPAEIWTFNLAADVIALLVAVDNLSKVKRTAVRDVLVSIDAGLGTHWCRSTIGNAAPGPEEFRQLRETVAHRKLLKW
ncbi:MAG: hypothetical protein ACYDH6_17575 [Acidimicrobiales bacterium]